jgi:amphi-Trp domain-containing protein
MSDRGSERNVSYKSAIDVDQAVTYLEELARSMRKGTVYIRHGDEEIELLPADGMGFELEASEKKGKQKLSIELSWRRGIDASETAGGLSIAATKPAAARKPDASATTPSKPSTDAPKKDGPAAPAPAAAHTPPKPKGASAAPPKSDAPAS